MLFLFLCGVLFALRFTHNNAFNTIGRAPLHHANLHRLYMGGKSPAEFGLSKKKLFRMVRDKIFEAAKLPGFFDVGEGAPELTLYCKTNRDGRQISDCPDTQFIQMVLLKKKLRYTLTPTLPSKRPEWLMEKHNGQLPALDYRGETSIVGTMAIAEFLEEKYPEVSLSRVGTFTYKEVLEKTKHFFPTLTALILNNDPALEEELRANMHAQLDMLDQLLRSAPGRFFGGIDMTLADLYLMPQLFHAIVTMDIFKKEEIMQINNYDPIRPGLEKFMEMMFKNKEFNDKKCYYSVDQVIYGWRVARGEAKGPV